MVISDVGDDHYFSTVLKIHFDTRIVSILGPRAKPLGFFTVRGWITAANLSTKIENAHPNVHFQKVKHCIVRNN
jgi:hypothetical protein